MTRITNVDQVLMLVRQQLQRMDKTGRPRRSKTSAERREPALGRVEEITRNGDLSEEELGHTLVAALLVDEFGETVANDPKFQQMIGEVHRIIVEDTHARQILRDALREVKKAAGRTG
jgi:hypothetical protein